MLNVWKLLKLFLSDFCHSLSEVAVCWAGVCSWYVHYISWWWCRIFWDLLQGSGAVSEIMPAIHQYEATLAQCRQKSKTVLGSWQSNARMHGHTHTHTHTVHTLSPPVLLLVHRCVNCEEIVKPNEQWCRLANKVSSAPSMVTAQAGNWKHKDYICAVPCLFGGPAIWLLWGTVFLSDY